jgi:hypothetical protein
MTYRDAEWFKEFEAAPVELRRAMNETAKAREDVDMLKRIGASESALRAQSRKVDALVIHERQLRNALNRDQTRRPISRKVAGIREAFKHDRPAGDTDPGDGVQPVDLDNL